METQAGVSVMGFWAGMIRESTIDDLGQWKPDDLYYYQLEQIHLRHHHRAPDWELARELKKLDRDWNRPEGLRLAVRREERKYFRDSYLFHFLFVAAVPVAFAAVVTIVPLLK
jgi:hypothetical protein